MAATGKTPILLYGSTTPTNAPVAGNLTNSSDGCEIAINVADKNLFFKDSTNVVNTVPIRQSSTSSNGWLSSTDWNTFNNKVSSQWVTSGSDIYYSTGNAGLGVVPSAWGSSYKAFQFASGAIAGFSTTALDIYGNAYDSGAGAWKYLNSSQGATRYAAFNGQHIWFTAPVGTAGDAVTFTQRMTLSATGDVTVNTGNLVIGTSGKGIDFSANSHSGGMTSELLDWYEEGSFTPTLSTDGASPSTTYSNRTGTYTRIGNTVHIQIGIEWTAFSGGGNAIIGGLPFAVPLYNPAKTVSMPVISSTVAALANYSISDFRTSGSYSSLYLYSFTGGVISAASVGASGTLTIKGFYFV